MKANFDNFDLTVQHHRDGFRKIVFTEGFLNWKVKTKTFKLHFLHNKQLNNFKITSADTEGTSFDFKNIHLVAHSL